MDRSDFNADQVPVGPRRIAACDCARFTGAQRRTPLTIISTLVMLLAPLSLGCRLPSFGRADADSLVTSRQLCQRGISAIERADWPAAESIMEQAVDACPNDWEAHRYYAEALWRQDKQDRALKEMDAAMRLAADNPAIRIRAAEMRLARGELPLAQQHAQEALDLNPSLAKAWFIRGRVSYREGEIGQALADYHRALSFEPNCREVLLEMAQLYGRTGRPERALLHLQRLLESYPHGEEPQQELYLAGISYRALGRFDDACESFALASQRGAPSTMLLNQHAEAQLAAGRPEMARRLLLEALAIEPQNAPSRFLLERVELAAHQNVTLNVR